MRKVQILSTGQVLSMNDVAAGHLVKSGFAKYVSKLTPDSPGTLKVEKAVVTPLETTATQIMHVGGGWYLLPNGEKVKGKEAALRAVKG